MYDFVIYMLQSGFCLAVFYMFYRVLLGHVTLHRFNRCLLLGIIILSAVLPLCRVTISPDGWIAGLVAMFADAPDSAVSGNRIVIIGSMPVRQPAFDPHLAVVVIFLAGALISALRTAISMVSLHRLVATGETHREGGVYITVSDLDVKPMSWMRRVVVSRPDYESEDFATILTHERAHIAMCHSWDILAIDIIGVLQWFNPALWLLRRDMQMLHEFEADAAVIRSGVNMREYQMLLVKKAAGSGLHSIANCLNHSNLKNRITMMLQKPSSRWSATRALLLLPLAGIVAVSLACTTNPQNKGNEKTMNVDTKTVTINREASAGSGEAVKIESNDPSSIDNAEIYLDGRKIDKAQMDNIDPATIEKVNVVKQSDTSRIEITTKK